MATIPCYATLHEEWLVKYKRHLQSSSKDLGAAMTIRAQRMMPLQAASIAAGSVVGAAQLLQQMTFEMDQDAGEVLPSLGLEEIALHISTCGQDCLEENDGNNNTADAFFDNYPECVRDAQCTDADHDEEEEEEEEEEVIVVDDPIVARNTQNHVSPHDAPPFAPAKPAQASKNPYAAPPPQRRAPQPPRNPYDQAYRPPSNNNIGSRNNNSNNNSNNNNNNSNSWDAVQSSTQQQNPFQSAKQFQYANPDANNDDYADDQGRDSLQRQRQAPPPLEEPAVPVRSNVPNSLKRKFQPPIKRSANENKGKKKVGGGGGTASARPEDGKKSDEDEDELPEALKGLDKELIEKIENEILDSGDVITFDDIAGLNDAKQTVQELVCWPMKRPDLFTGLRRGPNGLLLYGPPGTGKTLIGKAVAHESGATFFSISSSSLTSKWIGEGEKLVRTLFAVAAFREPAVVFIDEIDSLLTQRKADENEASRRIKTEFLVQLDGTGTSGQGRVLVIGATNRPHELDDAARRRFVKRLYIPLPVAADRQILFRTLLDKNKHQLTDAELEKLSAKMTDGFSGADLKALCVEAAMGPLRALGAKALEVAADAVPPIAYKHFRQALRGMNPSVSPADLEVYIEWDNTYGSRRANALNDEDSEEDEYNDFDTTT